MAATGAIRARLEQAPAEAPTRATVEPTPPDASAIELRKIRFGYPDRAELFQDLCLHISAGERVVLTGPSGGGKSTLIALLAGFLQPGRGEVRVDGEVLSALTDAARAAHIGWLGQRPWLIAGSIEDNLRLGDPSADAPALARALSGGQGQRIALARILVRPRPILLLDEPTASLDPDGEAQVLEALRHSLAVRPATVICASHRPALLDWASRVLEVRDGAVREVTR